MFMAWLYNGALIPPPKQGESDEDEVEDETPSARIVTGKDRGTMKT